jgi:hypothetical protein
MDFDRLPKPTDPWLFELWRRYQDLAFLNALSDSEPNPPAKVYITILRENCVCGILDYFEPTQNGLEPTSRMLRHSYPYQVIGHSTIPPILQARVNELRAEQEAIVAKAEQLKREEQRLRLEKQRLKEREIQDSVDSFETFM